MDRSAVLIGVRALDKRTECWNGAMHHSLMRVLNLPVPKSLVDGHLRFRRDVHAKDRGRYRQLAELGQAPTAMVIACCDARVDVSAIFDTEPGALFIMRNVANLVPP